MYRRILKMNEVPSITRALLTAVVMATAALALPSKLCKRSLLPETNMCPLNSSITMPQDVMIQHLFPGLFMGEQNVGDIYDGAFEIKSYKKVKKMRNVPCKNGKCYDNTRPKREVSDCCATETNILQLITVEKDSTEYSVVHLPSGSQYLTENSCASEEAVCGAGSCKSLLGVHWVLVADPNVAYYPPVRFVMVGFKMGCSCMP